MFENVILLEIVGLTQGHLWIYSIVLNNNIFFQDIFLDIFDSHRLVHRIAENLTKMYNSGLKFR